MSQFILNNKSTNPQEKKKFIPVESGESCLGCGINHIILIDSAEITKEQLEEGLQKWAAGANIQDALPFLSAECREILISGQCDESFNDMFGEDE